MVSDVRIICPINDINLPIKAVEIASDFNDLKEGEIKIKSQACWPPFYHWSDYAPFKIVWPNGSQWEAVGAIEKRPDNTDNSFIITINDCSISYG